MARPQIEFIQSQQIPWQKKSLWNDDCKLDVRILSQDDRTHASSLLLRYPAGFCEPIGCLDADEELLVLDGDLEIGGKDYRAYSYGHLPSGYDGGIRRSQNGAIVLTFYSQAPRTIATPRAFDPARLVDALNAMDVPYTGNFHPEFPPGAGRKVLYTDPDTKDTSWILGTMPLRYAERSEVHPVVEEMYLLSGEVHSDRGVMRPGAYFWRPPHIAHGPFGTLTGNLYFFRTKGGGLTTSYVDAERPFKWWPDHNPALPDELLKLAGDYPPSPRCW